MAVMRRDRIAFIRRHWMAIPTAVLIPLIVVAEVLAARYHWSGGTLGCVLVGLFGITAVVGSFMAPMPLE
jgi:hypothetical protein